MADEQLRRQRHALQAQIDVLSAAQRRLAEIIDDDQDQHQTHDAQAAAAHDLAVAGETPSVEAIPATSSSDDSFGGVPASAAAIAGLQKQRYHGLSSGAGDDTCVICFREYKKGTRLYALPCAFKHQFHRKCLKKWLARSNLCPLCRHALPTAAHRTSSM